MGALLFSHAAQLLTLRGPARARRGAEMAELGAIRDGAVLVVDGRIAAAGPSDDVMRAVPRDLEVEEIPCQRRLVTPGLVDCHTHVVFAAPRLDDFERRLRGEAYDAIAAAGGGIASSVRGVRAASPKQLLAQATGWLNEARAWGATTVEAKTGYGLELTAELKCLRVAQQAGEAARIDVPRTFLGAHTVPPERRNDRAGYIQELIEVMLPAAVADRAAPEFADAFCDPAGFTVEECRAVLQAAAGHGLKLKLHAEQFGTGGLTLGLELGAVSVDHLELVTAAGAAALGRAATIGVLLPGCNLVLGQPWAPARMLLEAGAAVALATDFNPGTCPIVSLPTIMALGCGGLRMTPAEVWQAATMNAAAALGRESICGSLEAGKRADLAVFEADDYRAVPYFAGANLCRGTAAAGVWRPN